MNVVFMSGRSTTQQQKAHQPYADGWWFHCFQFGMLKFQFTYGPRIYLGQAKSNQSKLKENKTAAEKFGIHQKI